MGLIASDGEVSHRTEPNAHMPVRLRGYTCYTYFYYFRLSALRESC